MRRLTTILLLMTILRPAALEAADDVIISEGIVNASTDRVWDAFTAKAGMESWMVAAGDIDLRVGGLMRTSYRKDADLNGDTAIHQSILSLDPGRMLSFRTIRPPKDFPFPNAIARTWTIVYFDETVDGRTKVTVKMLGYTSDPESQKMRAFFEVGNKATIDGLVKKFEK